MQDWELRDERFEELEMSDEEDGQGVLVDPHSYAARDAARARAFRGDELYFDGYDVGQDRHPRRQMYDQGRRDDMMHEVEHRDQRGLAYQAQVRGKEEALIQSALGRIARARAKGKTNVNLSEEEMEALQRRNHPQPEPPPALASPPPTPAKIPKSSSKTNSRSNSSTNLAGQKTRKRGSTGLFGNGSSSSPAKSNSKAKVNRKSSSEQQVPQALPYPMAAPGVMIPGPDGIPVYAALPYPPPSPAYRRTNSGGSQPGSRSGSKHSRRESTPPERTDPYGQYPMRYYPPPSMRPPSSSSNRSLPDDLDWYPPSAPRTRSASNAHPVPYPHPDQDVQPSLPAAQAVQGSPRRNVSGPAYTPGYPPGYPPAQSPGYASLRRTPAGSSPLAPRPAPGYASYSDPAITGGGRTNSGLRQQVRDESSESSSGGGSSDDQGVQVDILADEGGGYSISRHAALPHGASHAASHAAPPPLPAGGSGIGNEARKRRGERR